MQTKIMSIIIPYYRETPPELFLPLTSISGQLGVDFERIECILVGDGSHTKLSDDFLSLFAPLSVRLVYLDDNRGPGMARQAGIDRAAGEYLMFCDADDALHNVLVLKTFIAEIEKNHPDIIHSRVMMERYDADSKVCSYKAEESDSFQMLHGKVFSKTCLQTQNIRFHPKLRLHEDMYFNSIAAFYTGKVSRTTQISYMLKYRADSITHAGGMEYSVRTMPECIISAGFVCEMMEERYPEIMPAVVVNYIIGFYFLLHRRHWTEEGKARLLEEAERRFHEMIIPKLHWFEKAQKADIVSEYNRQRAALFAGEAETELLHEWLARLTQAKTV